jgi:hypothetical protein
VLRRTFGPKREEVAGAWRRLRNEELLKFYASPHIIRVIKSRRIKCVGHAALMEEVTISYKILIGKPKGS